ncbi:ABC transporter substrate-binding protein [Microbacterium sp. LRZ72]|uniref:ABC transporter substrate-binding protein n=1 Tax=Microbacterium sp. LRZ72 TaxID=2942481 RepID=UPI0029B936BB|nr:ABC transporter substrate-binding protein [Microbacterium sp. LRZ72]MDX2377662.1 ABC transporter substrate-binding protein [Microbacterium sp. LRZ72]
MATQSSRRSLLTSALAGTALLAATALAGCAPASSAGSDTEEAVVDREATYQLSWTHSVQFGGTYLALENGMFEDVGLDVTLAPGGPNVAGDVNTVSGESLVNISGGDGVARSNESDADLVIVGRQYQQAANTILSLAENPLETPEDLVGMRIGVAGTDTPALDAFLDINGLDSSDVEFVPTQYDPAALVAGQIDAIFCFYNDLPIALETQGIEGYSMLLSDFGYDPMSQVYTVLRENLEDDEKRQEIIDLLRADIQGWQAYREDPEAAAELTMEMFPDAGLDPETQSVQAEVQLDLMFSDLTDEYGFGWFTDEDVAANIELYEMLGIEADESLWDRSLLEEIYADGPVL